MAVEADVVVVHDPQPLPLVTHYRRNCPWVWRCHVDLSQPNAEAWRYLRGFVDEYDAMVVSLPEYAQEVGVPQLFFMPAIDPFSIKNRDLSAGEIEDRLGHYGIPDDLPIVAQISRFDRWKDPQGVIDAFKLARKQVDATLVLLGNVATDDPEGQEVFESLLECKEERILILTAEDSALVNALQRHAAVVLQKSLREGVRTDGHRGDVEGHRGHRRRLRRHPSPDRGRQERISRVLGRAGGRAHRRARARRRLAAPPRRGRARDGAREVPHEPAGRAVPGSLRCVRAALCAQPSARRGQAGVRAAGRAATGKGGVTWPDAARWRSSAPARPDWRRSRWCGDRPRTS
ncbi:MAG: glycosyltransferase [Burkholderiales bacterium]|nr:glycosyltransferase [Burkholderiales bacterium]